MGVGQNEFPYFQLPSANRKQYCCRIQEQWAESNFEQNQPLLMQMISL